MKKIILSSVLALTVVGGAYAQGTINWGNTALQANRITAQTNATAYSPLFGGGSTGNGTVGSTATTGGGFYYQLLFTNQVAYQVGDAQPTSLAALSGWSTATSISATNSMSIAGQLVPANQNVAANIGWAAGTTNDIVLVGWSANLGTSWSAALATMQSPSALGAVSGNAYFGMSATGYVSPTTASPGIAVFASSGAAASFGQPIFSLNTQLYLIPVPEPGTMALAALGGASLLLFRRRK